MVVTYLDQRLRSQTAMEKVRYGVVGLGAIGPSHIYAIKNTPGAELGAICDIDKERAEKAGTAEGVPVFTSVSEMADSGNIDAVSICTPSGYHLDPALEAVEKGMHLLVEKPLEITLERIDTILSKADEKEIKLGAVFQSRFNPAVMTLKRLVDNGLLGKIYSGSAYIKRYRSQEYYDSGGWRGTWQVDGGGCLMNQGIHFIDLYQWFLGKPSKITAVTQTVGRNVEVETLALAMVEFAEGHAGVIEATTLAYPEYPMYMEIFGSRGTIAFTNKKVLRMDLIDPSDEEKKERDKLFQMAGDYDASADKKTREQVKPGTAVPTVDMGHTPVFKDFTKAVLEDTQPMVTGEESRKAVELILGIYESGRHGGKPVVL